QRMAPLQRVDLLPQPRTADRGDENAAHQRERIEELRLHGGERVAQRRAWAGPVEPRPQLVRKLVTRDAARRMEGHGRSACPSRRSINGWSSIAPNARIRSAR